MELHGEFDQSFQQFGRKMSDDQLLFLALSKWDTIGYYSISSTDQSDRRAGQKRNHSSRSSRQKGICKSDVPHCKISSNLPIMHARSFSNLNGKAEHGNSKHCQVWPEHRSFYVFTNVMKSVVSILRKLGIRSILYFDMLMMSTNKEEANNTWQLWWSCWYPWDSLSIWRSVLSRTH